MESGPKQMVLILQGLQFMVGAPGEVPDPCVMLGLFYWVSFVTCALLDWDRFC